jgi:hypothetical protein
MYLHVLYDRSGKVLAAVNLDREKDAPGVPLPRPVAQRGQQTAEVSVPDEFRHLSFLEACTQLVVQAKGDSAMLVSRKPKPRATSRARPKKKAVQRKSRRR